jgi:hypothetical protein
MEQNIDKSKSSIQVEKSVVSPIEVTPYVAEQVDESNDDNGDNLDVLDIDLDGEEDSDEETVTEPEETVTEEEPVQKDEPQKKPKTREEKENIALKNKALRASERIAELEKELAETQKAKKVEDELAEQYIEEGHDEKEARKRAKNDIELENMRKQLAVLTFKEQNRLVLAKYPQADADLEKIMRLVKTGDATVEEICRGKYGNKPEREVRAIKALTDDSGQEQNNSVSKSIRTAQAPTRTKLTDGQLAAKRYIEKTYNNGKPITEEDFLKSYPT